MNQLLLVSLEYRQASYQPVTTHGGQPATVPREESRSTMLLDSSTSHTNVTIYLLAISIQFVEEYDLSPSCESKIFELDID